MVRARALHIAIYSYIKAREEEKRGTYREHELWRKVVYNLNGIRRVGVRRVLDSELSDSSNACFCCPATTHLVSREDWSMNFRVGHVLDIMSVDTYVKTIGVYENIGAIGSEERARKVRDIPPARRKAYLRKGGSVRQVMRMIDILKR